MNRFIFFLLSICLLPVWQATAQSLLDLETGVVFSGRYNLIRIPGNGGTQFNAADDNFSNSPTWFYRVRAGYTFNNRHTVSILFAPLKTKAEVMVPIQAIDFNRTTFAPGRALNVHYKFNSYRITYRYDFLRKDNIRFGAGLTGKIRDASIELENGEISSTKKDLGVVPLVNFYFNWNFARRVGLLLEGDALVGPQGRAEDVFGGFTYQFNELISAKAGYRILEGGANTDEVYNFSWFNYISTGVVIRW